MTDYEKRAFIAASEQVLCDTLPENYDDENWESKDGKTIDEWIVANAWEPHENWEAKDLWKQIDSVAYALKAFHKSEVRLALDAVPVQVLIP